MESILTVLDDMAYGLGLYAQTKNFSVKIEIPKELFFQLQREQRLVNFKGSSMTFTSASGVEVQVTHPEELRLNLKEDK